MKKDKQKELKPMEPGRPSLMNREIIMAEAMVLAVSCFSIGVVVGLAL